MILQSVTHYIESNTLEAVWIEPVTDEDGTVVSFARVKCRAYSQEQRDEFISDTGESKYADLAGW